MSEKKPIDVDTRIEQLVRREAQRVFGRDLGRIGVMNISRFCLDMIKSARELAAAAPPAPKQQELPT